MESQSLQSNQTGIFDYFKRNKDSQQAQQKEQKFLSDKDEFEDDFNLLITEEGIMKQTGVDYTSKFKDINWTSDINKELPIRISIDKTNGCGGESPITVSHAFIEKVTKFKDEECMKMLKLNKDNQAVVLSYTWLQYYDRSLQFAKALHILKVPERARVCFMGFNSPEHFMALMGTLMSNCVFTEVYLTNGSEACALQVQHSEAQVIVCDTMKRYREKFLPIMKQIPWVKAVILYDDQQHTNKKAKKGQDTTDGIRILNWKQMIEIGSQVENSVIEQKLQNQRPGMCCNLVYTSGTTGDPKGVMLSHDNMTWYWSAQNTIQNLRVAQYGPNFVSTDVIHQVSYLPLSHITAQMSDFTRLIVFNRPILLTFAPQEALTNSALMLATLRFARPTEFVAVPRVYEKFKEIIEIRARQSHGMISSLYEWAKSKGYENTINMTQGEPSPFGYNIAKLLVLKKIKMELGLDRIENAYFGAAPMSQDIKKFFMSLGMPLINVYGLSETSGAATYMDSTNLNFEKSGQPLLGTQIKIFNPDELGIGEICIRGRHIFMGYLNNQNATFDVMDSEGFFHTGDLGCLNEKTNHLDITGRQKELIITAGGENVSPILIEEALKEICPLISHVLVIGDERRYLTALFTIKCKAAEHQGSSRKELAPEVISLLQGLGLRGKTILDEIKSDPLVLTYIQKCVDQVNAKAISRVTQVKKWKILDRDFTIEGGELTPTLKVKRKVINKIHQDVIEQLYNDPKL